MANPSPSSLAEVVRQVAHQQQAQASEIGKSKAVLGQLQSQLHDLDTQMKLLVEETKAVERQMCLQDEAITATSSHGETLQAQITALYSENLKLKSDTEILQEECKMLLLRNRTYKEKIRAHRDQFAEVESKWPLMVEAANKRTTIKELIARKEELMSALQNPEGNAVNLVQDETACLESEINVLKEAVSEKENTLQEEKNIEARLRKEIEMENKRCKAILKRLHCQVNKLQARQRQGRWNIQSMENREEELRKRLGATD